jgi:hypothetical protein
MVKTLDAGFDVDQIALMERTVRALQAEGVTDEAEML